jgi:hypothetical protein
MGVAILSIMLIAILWVERTDPSANIMTAADALWATGSRLMRSHGGGRSRRSQAQPTRLLTRR